MKQIHQYITEELVDWIDGNLGETDAENKRYVPEVYKGYISSMGASLIQSGLVPTIAFYNDSGREGGKGGEWKKYHLLTILEKMLVKKEVDLENKSLPTLVFANKGNPSRLRHLQKEVINASIALKLTLRIFNLKKENTK